VTETFVALVALVVGEVWVLRYLRSPAMLRRSRFEQLGFRALPYVIGLWGGSILLLPALRREPLSEWWTYSLLFVVGAGMWLIATLEVFTTPTSVRRRVLFAVQPVLAIVWLLLLRSM
jgi:hypothetical protein